MGNVNGYVDGYVDGSVDGYVVRGRVSGRAGPSLARETGGNFHIPGIVTLKFTFGIAYTVDSSYAKS